jgi:mycothiol synthase
MLMAWPNEIVECPENRRADAIELVLRELTPEQQIAIVASMPLPKGNALEPFATLFVVMDGEQLVAAVWAQPHAGHTATLWTPQFATTNDDRLARALIDTCIRRVGESDTAIVQAIIEPSSARPTNLLQDAGFSHAANLLYLEWFSEVLEVGCSTLLRFETYNAQLKSRMKNVIGRTYVGSLDCPILDKMRSLDDVLDGYQATGDFDPNLWMIASAEGLDVGVLLLAPYTKTQQIELMYMGVVPEARSRGIGAALLRCAQSAAVERRAEKLLLAVDAENSPARTLYQRAGFREWSQRRVYLRALPSRA